MTEATEHRAGDLTEADRHTITTGRTGWDAAAGVVQSRMVWVFLWTLLAAAIVWALWDAITALPVYALSSVALSVLWYGPISSWLSRQSMFVEVWCPDTNTLTTYRVGRQLYGNLARKGLNNQVASKSGNNRIFASRFDPIDNVLETTWVHDHDPWTYHRERQTITRLTGVVNDVLEDINVGEAMAQVEGRRHAMASMRKHYADLDALFFGQVQPAPSDIQPKEAHQ